MSGYSIEYAKSGRATCHGCDKNIANGYLRVGKTVEGKRGEEWYHEDCFVKKEQLPNVKKLKGFDALLAEDQAKLKKKAKSDEEDPVLENMDEEKKTKKEKTSKAAAASSSPKEYHPFEAEYAKTSRSSCSECKSKIEKGSLRIASNEKSNRFTKGGYVPHWYHHACFFQYNSIPTPDDLYGLLSLRTDDQEMIKQAIDKNIKNPPPPREKDNEKTKKKRKAEAGKEKEEGDDNDGEDEEGDDKEEADELNPFKVEYASSSRSTCVECDKKIDKGALRLGVAEESDRFEKNGVVMHWFHRDCAFKSDDVKIPSDDVVDGIDDLRDEDAKQIREFITKNSSSSSSSSGSAKKSKSNQPDKKKAKTNDDDNDNDNDDQEDE